MPEHDNDDYVRRKEEALRELSLELAQSILLFFHGGVRVLQSPKPPMKKNSCVACNNSKRL